MKNINGEKDIKNLRNISVIWCGVFVLYFILAIYTGNKVQSIIGGLGVIVIGIQLYMTQRKLNNKVYKKSN